MKVMQIGGIAFVGAVLVVFGVARTRRKGRGPSARKRS
jgi:hypothetical protein